MTRDEFDRWLVAHYADLLKVARQRDRLAPTDILHQAIAGMLASPALPSIGTGMGAWPWAVGFIRGTASVVRRGRTRNQALREELKNVYNAGSSPK